ncbi:MAG: hypothetical protein IJX65_01305, partial [Alistipes sp.]|nr:hypothetical protein [Alistipes sp.]
MKKIFIAFMSLVALVACNSDYTVETLDSTPILFGDSFVQNKTRAANEADQSTVITTANIAAFDVWGFMDDASGVVFNAERVTKTDGKWTYANLQYWLPKHTYYFGAVAPVDSQNITVTTAEDVTGGLGTIAFVNTGVEDLIYAEQKVTTPDVISGNLDPVSLQFAHLLAKAKFTFINGFKNENATIKVTNIKITNAPQAGTIDLTVDPTAWAWQLDSTKTFELGFGDANGGAAIPALDAEATVDNAAESDYVRYILPSNGDYVYYNLSFDVELYMGDKLGLKATRTATITKQNILIGKAYNFVATIDATNIAEDALQPIEFDDITVEDWDEFGDVEYTPTTPEEGEGDEPTTPENPETPAEPVVLYLQPNANWNTDGARYAAYFFDGNGGETWVDLALVDGETNVYSLTAPEGYANVIFCRMNPSTTENNWDNKWNQTADLTVPTDENTLYTVPADAWDNSDNTNWSVYTPTTTPEEPEVPAVTYTTVAEFLAAAEDDTTLYTLKGTITAVANTTYGNFDLTDETGTVYIYGLCSPEGASKYWAESGAKLGDDIVIKTIRTSFNSAPQGKNATFVERTSPGTLAFWSFDTTSVSFTAAAAEKAISLSIYNTDAAVTATSDNAQFSAAYADGVLTVSALE